MKQLIEKIYETNSIVGQSGKVHVLDSSIGPRGGAFLRGIIDNDADVVKTLEVGCAYGLSSLYICSALRGRAEVSHTIIDPYQTTQWDGGGLRNLKEAGVDFFHFIEEKSEIALPRLLENSEGQFDFVFVDGFHTFDHTLLDCFYATRLLRVGGYLAIDDVNFSSISRVAAYLKRYPCYKVWSCVDNQSIWTWRKALLCLAMLPIPRSLWAKFLKPSLYSRIFDRRRVVMLCLKKIDKDIRDWNWHDDRF